MPKEVIDRVHTLARRSKASRTLEWTWRDGTPIDDVAYDENDDANDEDYEYTAPDDDGSDNENNDDDNDVDAHDDDDIDHTEHDNDNYDDNENDNENENTDASDDTGIAGVMNENNEEENNDEDETDNARRVRFEDDTIPEAEPEQNVETAGVTDEITGVEDEIIDTAGVDDEIVETAGVGNKTPTHGHNLRPKAPRDYKHAHVTIENIVMTQHSIKKGLKLYGEAGAEAVVSEMQQLHDRDVIEPKSANMLTNEEKKKALHYLMFLKKKRCGRIKGRGCADGRKQRIYKTKEETSAPTVAIESLFLSSVIDAKEERSVVTLDIPGAFMQADMDEVLYMKLEGPLAHLLTKVDPEQYSQFMATERGKQVIYVKLKKALYGTLQAALLFWKDLSGYLKEMGFELNPYDRCVANKMIDGKQCTILWHVDDLKISHENDEVIENVISTLSERYGKEAPLVVTRGKVHDYLGMTLDFSVKGKVKVIMKDYIQDMLDDLPSDMDGEAVNPAAEHLFTANENPVPLDEPTSQMFHTNTAKLLFLSKRARPDVQPAVAYLTTRVISPDEDDYKKLSRVMKYLRGSIDRVLTLEADRAHVVKWWVDAAFAVHHDMKSHTGGTMSLGKGSIYSTSVRQKLNTKSSTEAELVGVDDVMPQIIWTRLFLEAQGYGVHESRIYQDNQSAMLMEKNGKASTSKRTRHINIRYFFVADRVQNKEVTIEYCPTGDMTGDFFTKALQGSPFVKFRNEVLNCE